jgi:colanic acid/amylovoran biosynthesis glycosyltransferase
MKLEAHKANGKSASTHAAVSSPAPSKSTPQAPLSLAYLTTEYPKVSHSFIRREIVELARRGHTVMRLAIRPGAVKDEQDRAEAAQTFVCLEQPRSRMLADAAWFQTFRPRRWIAAALMAARMSRASDRGLLRHGAYLVEAAVLARRCEAHGVRHVHVHFGTNAAAVARLMRCLGGPSYSMTIHGPDEFDSVKGFSLTEKAVDAAFVVAISEFGAAQLKRWVPLEHWSKIHVVHCSVGDEFFSQAVPVQAACKTLLSIGRLSAQKGQLVLVEAMRRLLLRCPEARLVLAGDGEMRAEVEGAIRAAGIERQVTITGWIDELTVRQLLKDARALVQPSFAEGLPVVMMESLAMARPVIGTRIAGIPELVRPLENGWLVTAGNVDELVDAMEEAMRASPSRLDEMGKAGQARVRARHATVTEVDKLEALLRAQLSDASPVAGAPFAL